MLVIADGRVNGHVPDVITFPNVNQRRRSFQPEIAYDAQKRSSMLAASMLEA
jgi:hypothetical protein